MEEKEEPLFSPNITRNNSLLAFRDRKNKPKKETKLVYTEVLKPGEVSRLPIFEDFPEAYHFEVRPYSEEAFSKISEHPLKEYKNIKRQNSDFLEGNLISIQNLINTKSQLIKYSLRYSKHEEMIFVSHISYS